MSLFWGSSTSAEEFSNRACLLAGLSASGEVDAADEAPPPALQTILSGLPSEQQSEERSAPYDALPTPAVFASRPSFKRPTVDDSSAPAPELEVKAFNSCYCCALICQAKQISA